MIKAEEITQTIKEMEHVSDKLLCCEEDAYLEFERQCGKWMNVINQVLTELSVWKQVEENFSIGIILQQIRNLETALKNKDDFMLADTLKYEISKMLEYYLEMVGKYGRK